MNKPIGQEVEPLLQTVEGTARVLNVGRSTVYELLKSNELEAVKIGRSRRITTASIKAMVSRRMGGEAA